MSDHASEDKGQDEDEWEPAPSTKGKAAATGRKRDLPARKGRGGKERQVVDTDSQSSDTVEDEEEQQQLVSRHAKGKQQRKRQVIQDDNLEDMQIAEVGSSKPLQEEAAFSNDQNAGTDAADAIPQSSAALQAEILGTKASQTAKASEQLAWLKGAVKQVSKHSAVANGHSDMQEGESMGTSQPGCAAHPAGSAQPASEFSLLDAILNPDNGKQEPASGLLAQSGKTTPQQAQTDDQHASQDVARAPKILQKSGQPQNTEQEVDEAKVSESQAASSHPSVKGSLRERMKAFAALKK